jgi:phosphopantothenoylcysteine decarboxylase/phosphopantothenate--cysteine ligase
VTVVRIESAREMLDACRKALPVDVAVCAAAVADWRPADAKAEKIKKGGGAAPAIALAENPDILKALSGAGNFRPRLVIGFAAETGDVVAKAEPKRRAKGCDWLVANDVATGTGTFGGDDNSVHLITADGTEDWPRMTKRAVAERLAGRIAAALAAAPGAA